jgi:hypothetical protein
MNERNKIIQSVKKFIGSIILPKFPEIKNFEVLDLDDKIISLNLYVDGIDEQYEIEIQELVLDMKDYLGISENVKIFLNFIII